MSDPILRTEGLTRRYGKFVAVDRVDIAVERGEFHSVIGPNGAGKTTLFNTISGALSASEGSVRFDGEDVTDLPPEERVRRGMGRSFQISNVFDGLSVRENVRLAVQATDDGGPEGLRGVAEWLFRPTSTRTDHRERADAVLADVGLADRADEPAAALSHGDRRRLEIGIVLAADPTLVLFDEPTAGMGSDDTREIIDLVGDVLADKTLLLIEHDIELVMELSDTITVLNRGTVLAEGPPNAVASDPDVQEAYLGGMDS